MYKKLLRVAKECNINLTQLIFNNGYLFHHNLQTISTTCFIEIEFLNTLGKSKQ